MITDKEIIAGLRGQLDQVGKCAMEAAYELAALVTERDKLMVDNKNLEFKEAEYIVQIVKLQAVARAAEEVVKEASEHNPLWERVRTKYIFALQEALAALKETK
jgi:uncharacterized protein YbcI